MPVINRPAAAYTSALVASVPTGARVKRLKTSSIVGLLIGFFSDGSEATSFSASHSVRGGRREAEKKCPRLSATEFQQLPGGQAKLAE